MSRPARSTGSMSIVMDMLSRLRRHRTIVLVTHRIQTVTECDQIFVMGGGHVLTQGTHAQLLADGALNQRPGVKKAAVREDEPSADAVTTTGEAA